MLIFFGARKWPDRGEILEFAYLMSTIYSMSSLQNRTCMDLRLQNLQVWVIAPHGIYTSPSSPCMTVVFEFSAQPSLATFSYDEVLVL